MSHKSLRSAIKKRYPKVVSKTVEPVEQPIEQPVEQQEENVEQTTNQSANENRYVFNNGGVLGAFKLKPFSGFGTFGAFNIQR
ncbi:MAG: hypothetical protein MJ250_02830 [Alphaproteobacteria bacterium]|nr:hypothetical protein [Alphaproteobacteria bacterium]